MHALRYFHQVPKTTTSTTAVDNTAVQTITAVLDTKADKVVGKGFSQNNYSTIEKTKLRGIEEGAEVNVQSDWNETDTESDAFILNKPDIPVLDQSGQIPARYLPSYVDDVLEYSSTSAFPNPGETGKIYVDTSTDLTYRWSGSTYVEISKSILTGVKGDAESTYRVGNVNLTATNIGLGNVANIDLSKAIKSITRSGTTFTYTCLDGTTGTFTLQDNNTTYSAGTGLSLSGTTFSLALTKALITSALGYTPAQEGSVENYLPLSGGTITGSLNVNSQTTTWILNIKDVSTKQIVGNITGMDGSSYKCFEVLAKSGFDCEIGPDNGRYLYMKAGTNYGGIGTQNPSYKLEVLGDVAANSFVNRSDIRDKNILKDYSISIDSIAEAPSFVFTWNDKESNNKTYVGSSAQYWKNIVPEAVCAAQDNKNTLSMLYDVLALLSSISVAKEVVKTQNKIDTLEQRILQLENLLSKLIK